MARGGREPVAATGFSSLKQDFIVHHANLPSFWSEHAVHKKAQGDFFIHNGGVQVIQERRGIVSKLEIEARMRENKAQAQVIASMYFQEFFKIWWPRDLIFNILSKNSSKIIFKGE